MYHLNMANIKISIEFKHDAYVRNHVKPYIIPGDEKTDHHLFVNYVDEVKPTDAPNFRVFAKDKEGIRAGMIYDDKFQQVEVLIRKHAFTEAFLDNVEYIYFGMIFLEISFQYGFLPLHGSVIKFKDEGVMFSAPSGTGKTTHTNMWKGYFKDEVTYINDDKPLIKIEDGIIYAYGTLFSGEDRKNTNAKVKLKNIIYLKQGLTNDLIALDKKAAATRLIHNSLRPNNEKHWDQVLNQINYLVEHLGFYELDATKSIDAVLKVYEKLFGGKV